MFALILVLVLTGIAAARPIDMTPSDWSEIRRSEVRSTVTAPTPVPVLVEATPTPAPAATGERQTNCAWESPNEGVHIVRASCLEHYIAFEAPNHDPSAVPYCMPGGAGPLEGMFGVIWGPQTGVTFGVRVKIPYRIYNDKIRK